jgi:hypothetical protein
MLGKSPDTDRCSCGLAMDSRIGHAYNEEAFRYLLSLQRKRAERSDQPFLLVLVDFAGESGSAARIDPMLARKLFSGLCCALRETDLIGWYREEQIAGALLPAPGGQSWPEVSAIVTQRIDRILSESLPESAADDFRFGSVRFSRSSIADRDISGAPHARRSW